MNDVTVMSTDPERHTTRNVARRRRQMLEAVTEAGSAQVDELASRFSVSRMTVHRDLDDLAEQGLVRKVHGGVTTRASALVESNIALRQHASEAEKRAIGRLAADLIEPGQAIILDDSTTAAAPLTVLTNSLGAAQALAGLPGIKVMCLGGLYLPTYNAFFGLICEQAIASLHASTLFLSASTVIGLAAYHQEAEVVTTKRALMQIVDRRVFMVGSDKFGMTALHRLADLSEFDIVLSDGGLDPQRRLDLTKAGIDLRIAGDTSIA
jgi:DeoR/GlpR family transcriptional regulator of sugar metabolism